MFMMKAIFIMMKIIIITMVIMKMLGFKIKIKSTMKMEIIKT